MAHALHSGPAVSEARWPKGNFYALDKPCDTGAEYLLSPSNIGRRLPVESILGPFLIAEKLSTTSVWLGRHILIRVDAPRCTAAWNAPDNSQTMALKKSKINGTSANCMNSTYRDDAPVASK